MRSLALLSAVAIVYPACGDDDTSGDDGGGRGGAGARGGSAGASARAGAGGSSAAGAAGSPDEGGSGGSLAAEGGAPTTPGGGVAAGGAQSGSSGFGGGGAGAGDAGSAATEGGSGGLGAFGGAGGEGVAFCATLDPTGAGVTARRCLDFDAAGNLAELTVEGGTWQIDGGELVGVGPDEPVSCAEDGFGMTAAVVSGFSATDVRVQVELTGVDRPDKIVILRSQDFENRVELNFRSTYESGGVPDGGDLVVQEVVDCEGTFRVAPGEVSVPHGLTDTLDVVIELRGQRLIVVVNEEPVMDRTFQGENALSALPGSAGMGVNLSSTVRFDDLVVEALAPATD